MSGPKMLRGFLEERGLSGRRFAEWLRDGKQGPSAQFLSKVIKGTEIPSAELAFALEDLTGISNLARKLQIRDHDPVALVRAKQRVRPDMDTPFAGEITLREVSGGEAEDEAEGDTEETPTMGAEKVKVTLLLDADRLERLRRIRWWLGGSNTMIAIVTRGIDMVLTFYEGQPYELFHPDTRERVFKPAGQPFPPRTGSIPVGRVP